METSTPDGLPARWKERAEYLRQFGDPSCAKLWELAASELQAALEASGEQALTLVEAAKLTGLTADYLGQLVRGGKLRNAGRPKAPRVRRADLPIKSTRGRPPKSDALSPERESALVERAARAFGKKR
jgi:hypothetical protein